MRRDDGGKSGHACVTCALCNEGASENAPHELFLEPPCLTLTLTFMEVSASTTPEPHTCSYHSVYLDLYGNDEADFSEQVPEDEKKDAQFYEQSIPLGTTLPASNMATTDPRLASRMDTKPIQAAPASPASATATLTAGSAIQAYATPQLQDPSTPPPSAGLQMPLTQKIPTYEQPQSGYRDTSRLSTERTIRPSEMKDEG